MTSHRKDLFVLVDELKLSRRKKEMNRSHRFHAINLKLFHFDFYCKRFQGRRNAVHEPDRKLKFKTFSRCLSINRKGNGKKSHSISQI